MACRALQARDAIASGTSHHVGEMTPSLVTLLRIIDGRVTIDAARMDEDGVDLLPGGKSVGSARARTDWTLLGRTAESAETQNN
jgi:hypothetical protein